MGKIGKVSTIKKQYNSSQLQTMDSNLAQQGMTRIPGTGVFKYPYKELDGKYRTGLDPDCWIHQTYSRSYRTRTRN